MIFPRWNHVLFQNLKHNFTKFSVIIIFLGVLFACTSAPCYRHNLEGVWWDGAQPKDVGSEISARVLRLCPDGRLVINQCLVLFSEEGEADIGEGSIWVGEWEVIDDHIYLRYHLQSEAPIPDKKLSTEAQHMVLFISTDGLQGENVKFSPLPKVLKSTLETQLSCKFSKERR